MHSETRTISISEVVRLSVELAGAGEPLILLPGLGNSIRSFEPLMRQLVRRDFHVVAINPRGIAGSTGPLEGLTLHDLAADVAGLIDVLNLAPAHLLGWAYGNRVARCVAVDAPTVVQSVILLAAGGLVPPDDETAAIIGRVAGDHGLTDDERRDLQRRVLFSPGADTRLVKWLDTGAWPEATAVQVTATRATPTRDWWSGGAVPMLVMQGTEDRVASPANGHALRDEYGDRARVIDFPDCGHCLHLEQPEAVAAAIDEWIRDRK